MKTTVSLTDKNAAAPACRLKMLNYKLSPIPSAPKKVNWILANPVTEEEVNIQ